MKRLLLAALMASGCIDFDQLEGDALDAGGFFGGGTAQAGGSAAGGSAAGGSAAGGSAAGGSAAGGSAAGGSAAGGSAGGVDAGALVGRPPEIWSGIAIARTPNSYIAVAATTGNGNYLSVERTDSNLLVRAVNNTSFSFDSGVVVHDLDARFSLAALTTSQGVFVLDEGGSWSPLQLAVTPAGTPTSTAIFQPSMSGPKLASFWRLNTVTAYSANRIAGGFSLGGTGTTLGASGLVLGRPTEAGDAGLALSGSGLERVDSYAPTSELFGSNIGITDLRLASSESQVALLGWRQPAAGRTAAWLWRPGVSRALPMQPDVLVEGNAGVPTLHAIATNGIRHAAILGPTAQNGSSFWVNGDVDGGVAVATSVWLLVTFSDSGDARFITLGPSVQSPVALAFGSAGADAGLFVMANCVTSTNDPSLCSQQGGGVIGFLQVP